MPIPKKHVELVQELAKRGPSPAKILAEALPIWFKNATSAASALRSLKDLGYVSHREGEENLKVWFITPDGERELEAIA